MSRHDLPPTSRSWQKALAVGLTALALLVLAFVTVRQVEKNPLRMDEVDMYSSIANWVTLGTPLLYLGQPMPPDDWLLPLGERTLGDGQTYSFYRIKPETGVTKEFFIAAREGLVGRYTYFPHPQLYLAGHALLYRLLPLTPDTSHLMRYFNLLWVAGLIVGMALLSRELYGRHSLSLVRAPDRAWLVFAVALLLLALNSFAVRAALLIDYQAPTACLAVWYAWAFVRSQERGRLSWGLALITLIFWFSNLGAPISILAGTAVYVLLLGWRARPWRALASVAIGTAAFVPAYGLFCRIFDLPFSQPFIYIASRASGPGGMAATLSAAWEYSLWYVQEIGPWLVAAALVLFLVALVDRRAIRRPALALPPLLAFTGILMQAAARGDAFHFPKYVFFTVPLLCIFVAGELVTWISAAWSGRPAGRRWAALLLAGGLALLLGLSAAQSWRSIQAPGGTLYDPGEVGLVEAAQAARAEAPPDAILLARKDAGFFAQRPFIEWEGPLLTDPALLQQTIEQYGIRYLVAGPLLLGPEAQATWPYLAGAFEVVLDAGDYVLLRKY